MKKSYLALFLAFAMLLPLASCGSKTLLDPKEPVELDVEEPAEEIWEFFCGIRQE